MASASGHKKKNLNIIIDNGAEVNKSNSKRESLSPAELLENRQISKDRKHMMLPLAESEET